MNHVIGWVRTDRSLFSKTSGANTDVRVGQLSHAASRSEVTVGTGARVSGPHPESDPLGVSKVKRRARRPRRPPGGRTDQPRQSAAEAKSARRLEPAVRAGHSRVKNALSERPVREQPSAGMLGSPGGPASSGLPPMPSSALFRTLCVCTQTAEGRSWAGRGAHSARPWLSEAGLGAQRERRGLPAAGTSPPGAHPSHRSLPLTFPLQPSSLPVGRPMEGGRSIWNDCYLCTVRFNSASPWDRGPSAGRVLSGPDGIRSGCRGTEWRIL